MVQFLRSSIARNLLISWSRDICVRAASAQAAISYIPSNDAEYAKAKTFDEVPGLTKFELLRRFVPGGKFHKMPMLDVFKSMRDEYGNLYKMPGLFGQKAMLITFDANGIEFIHRNEGTYPHRKGLETMMHFRQKIRSDIFEVGGLVIEQGAEWHKMRSAVNPILMQPKIVKSYIPLIDSIVIDFMRNIPDIQSDNGEMPGNFNEYLNRWSLESITAIALEKRLGLMDFNKANDAADKITTMIRKIFKLSLDLEIKPSIWRWYKTKEFKELMQAYNDLTELSSTLIEEAKLRFERSDYATNEADQGVLYKLLQKDKRFATVMAFDMIFAGVDTTTSAVSSTMYLLARHPEKQEKLRNELKEIMPDRNSVLTGENMKNMPYLRAVIKETLRLLSPQIGNMRRTADNIVLKGYQIPKDVDIFLGLMYMYKDDQYFGNPEEFVPERWLRQEQSDEVCPNSMKQSHPFAYLPFGYGVRFCVGKRIAEMELEVFISRLFRNYKVEWHHGDLKLKSTLVNMLDGELKFKMMKI